MRKNNGSKIFSSKNADRLIDESMGFKSVTPNTLFANNEVRGKSREESRNNLFRWESEEPCWFL